MTFLQILTNEVAKNSLQLFDTFNLNFLLRILIDIITVIIITRWIYYKYYKRADLFLTFFAFNLIIFLITFLLNKVEMTMGAAFGLFAVFSMLRYRTENITAKDMTYLFIVIAIGLVMAVSKGNWLELIIIGGIIIFFTKALESNWLIRREFSQHIYYENILLIHPDKREEMIEDLKNRTGLNIHRVEVQEIDFLKDAAKIIVYYH
jgi:ABC-type uncharacterized transport system fused permease/ATPase subunit